MSEFSKFCSEDMYCRRPKVQLRQQRALGCRLTTLALEPCMHSGVGEAGDTTQRPGYCPVSASCHPQCHVLRQIQPETAGVNPGAAPLCPLPPSWSPHWTSRPPMGLGNGKPRTEPRAPEPGPSVTGVGGLKKALKCCSHRLSTAGVSLPAQTPAPDSLTFA